MKRDQSGSIRVIVALVILVLGIAAVAGMYTGILPKLLGSSSSSSASSTAAATTETADSFSEYSWAQLSQISNEIEAAGGGDASVEVARSYGLVDAAGNLTTETHPLALGDGTTIPVRLAGIMVDDKSDGSGKAGLTLVTWSAIAEHAMNDTATVDGGWEASSMRAWLNSDELGQLPSELTSLIVPVDKLTNNSGNTSDADAVTATSDTLWLLSAREVTGDIDWFGQEYGGSFSSFDDVLNAEGEQYQCFAQAGVTSSVDPSSTLVRAYHGTACAWFYRSAFQLTWSVDETGYYFYSCLDSGFPHGQTTAVDPAGVVVGFCL